MVSEDAPFEALGYRRARTLSDGPLAEVVLVESLANPHRLEEDPQAAVSCGPREPGALHG
jgi:hypothetical protein